MFLVELPTGFIVV